MKRRLRAEMTRRGVTYEDLTGKLAGIGVHDTAVNIRNKVARGTFTAIFEGYYNRQRLHSALGYITSEQAERRTA